MKATLRWHWAFVKVIAACSKWIHDSITFNMDVKGLSGMIRFHNETLLIEPSTETQNQHLLHIVYPPQSSVLRHISLADDQVFHQPATQVRRKRNIDYDDYGNEVTNTVNTPQESVSFEFISISIQLIPKPLPFQFVATEIMMIGAKRRRRTMPSMTTKMPSYRTGAHIIFQVKVWRLLINDPLLGLSRLRTTTRIRRRKWQKYDCHPTKTRSLITARRMRSTTRRMLTDLPSTSCGMYPKVSITKLLLRVQ